jgi:WD40 repeat protein
VNYSTQLIGHSAGIEKVAFNPVKDAELASVSSDGVVKFWDVRTKAVINEVKGLGDAFTLVWAPDGESLVVGNKVWSLSSVHSLNIPVLTIILPILLRFWCILQTGVSLKAG